LGVCDLFMQPSVKPGTNNLKKAEVKSTNSAVTNSSRSNQQAEPVKPPAQTVDLLGLGE